MNEPSPEAKQAAAEHAYNPSSYSGEMFCEGYDAALRAVGSTEPEATAKLRERIVQLEEYANDLGKEKAKLREIAQHYIDLFDEIRQALGGLVPTDASKKEIIDKIKELAQAAQARISGETNKREEQK